MTKNAKRILVLLASAGVIAVVVGGSTGTFASFNAEVQNNGNTFTTGTLFLHDTAGATTCTSESASSNDNTGLNGDTCSANFQVSNHGGAADTTYYNLVLKNAGSIDASSVKFYRVGSCTPSTVGIADGLVSGAQSTVSDITLDGSGTIAIPGGSTVSIGNQTGLTTTAAVTAVGATTLHLTAPVTVADGDVVKFFPAIGGSAGNLCSAVTFSIYDMGATVGATSPSGGTCIYPADCVTGTALSSLPSAAAAFTVPEGLTSGQSRNLLIAVANPSLDNSYQSQKAALDIGWHIDE
jgi:predicted ribosomally synthesized peptide with SipW-like signal peptide